MANEISRTTRLAWTRNGAQIIATVTESIDQIGEQAIESVQIIGQTSEAINLGDVTTPKYVMFKNANNKWSDLTNAQKEATGYATEAQYNAANIVHVGATSPATSVNASFALNPGNGASIISTQAAWYAIGITEDVNLLVIAIEE